MPKCRKFHVFIPFITLGLLLPLTACTTYTWPDGSQETVLGVVPENENQRYEEQRAEGVRYRLPGDIPE
ncbi:hypothetical protein P8S55_01450 [Halomonas sp. M1]|uniref:hypothetical protein n=1 Tax=unclassified Halomonas TaxID=2609666 RepID=UPI00023A3D0C|nr:MULTISPECIES: hypothetical protein [unclassified Halomonas]AVI63597.1 hypothetical protein BB497_13215 [Halomonas sp. GFAJ-1]EHK61584.1 hypothetical protein MOY_06036 [Halomonas sp. GFAJ-1]MDP3536923.1 hypothetical protein [Halomonas sp.]WFE71766.1 hypothetical protein P8S55_01450 [Halomonas sp. M1]